MCVSFHKARPADDHGWGCVNRKPGKIINVYQPAGNLEEFFRELGSITASHTSMKSCRLMKFVGCSMTTGRIFSAHPSWENGKSKKTDESHRSRNRAATSRTALHLLNPPEQRPSWPDFVQPPMSPGAD